ncbi:MAG TPA: ubiquitin-like protein Pup [Nitrospiria bacterium]|nr:ubiquitin-like protein Pup [Nitrospiria bacterium]
MAHQEKKQAKRRDSDRKEEAATANPEVVEKGKALKKDMDELLDDIDDVLEENAEEFVKNYVQKGGE